MHQALAAPVGCTKLAPYGAVALAHAKKWVIGRGKEKGKREDDGDGGRQEE